MNFDFEKESGIVVDSWIEAQPEDEVIDIKLLRSMFAEFGKRCAAQALEDGAELVMAYADCSGFGTDCESKGAQIVDAIIKGKMLKTIDPETGMELPPIVIVWSANANEQLGQIVVEAQNKRAAHIEKELRSRAASLQKGGEKA